MTKQFNYILNLAQDQISFNVSGYQTGAYNAILVCDGKATDIKTLVVQ